MNGKEWTENNGGIMLTRKIPWQEELAETFDAGVAEGVRANEATFSRQLEGNAKPDRRAELLDLASKLIIAVWSRENHEQEWVIKKDGTFDANKFYNSLAADSVGQAAAIIDAVDKSVGMP